MRDGLNKAAGDGRRQQEKQLLDETEKHRISAGIHLAPTSGSGASQLNSSSPTFAFTSVQSDCFNSSSRPKSQLTTKIIRDKDKQLEPATSSSSSSSSSSRLQKRSDNHPTTIITNEAADLGQSIKVERQQKSSPIRRSNDHVLETNPVERQVETDVEERKGKRDDDDDDKVNNRRKINYWNYKQTGIKSRPIKLIKHPIEHIERKIILTYLLGFLFKFIAIITGPLIVLLVYLMTVPFVAFRHSNWFMFNCLFDARIRTISDDELCNSLGTKTNKKKNKGKLEKQIYWNYCPLNYLETYWFKEKLVNTVIMVIENDKNNRDSEGSLSIDKLRYLVRNNLLSKPTYRKFLSRVVKRGIPFYKSYYWHHLGLPDEITISRIQVNENNDLDLDLDFIDGSIREGRDSCCSADSSLVGQFSSSSNIETGAAQNVSISIDHQHLSDTAKPEVLQLDKHIFIDNNYRCFHDFGTNRSTIRQYVSQLVDLKLDKNRPLWEIRLIPPMGGKKRGEGEANNKSYLIFRCHQSLADGRSLSKILTDSLTLKNNNEQDKQNLASAEGQNKSEDNDDETELRPIKEKASFVERVSKANSVKSAILVGPLTVLLWIIWTFSRRKNNHLNKCQQLKNRKKSSEHEESQFHHRRFYMTSYSLTKIHQIKQMTRSTVSDVILCALSGALRDYLRNFNGITNPPNLNISLTVDMRQQEVDKKRTRRTSSGVGQQSSIRDNLSTSTKESEDEHQVAPSVNCTLINVPLPTSIEGAVPRLWELRNTMEELRSSADPWVMLGLQKFLFHLLPVSWYQWLINYVALRNSSTCVSNIRGPQNLVESWCVDLLQRAIYESQQPPKTIQTDPSTIGNGDEFYDLANPTNQDKPKSGKRHEVNREKRVKFRENLGHISEIYYCMQPPTGDIPISFNCITYYNKLFITSMSRSLLVEDSKLLIRLFFRQLDQLTNTIAKRRSLVTIVRTPVPIEISCQPASPPSSNLQSPTSVFLLNSTTATTITSNQAEDATDEATDSESINLQLIEKSRAPKPITVAYRYKDDLEANLSGDRSDRCKNCDKPVCTCRRRKSLFSFDSANQRHNNLLSLLVPLHLVSSRSSGSRGWTNEAQDAQWNIVSGSTNPIECLCGQQLLEELDEEEIGGGDENDKVEVSSTGSRTPSDMDGSRLGQFRSNGGEQVSCSKCNRRVSKRSTLSLNAEAGVNNSQTSNKPPGSGGSPRLSRIGSKRTTHSSAQLNVPKQNNKFQPKVHSKSETDLLPAGREDKSTYHQDQAERGSKDSWFAKGRLSLFTKSNSQTTGAHNNQQRSMSSRSSQIAGSQEEAIGGSKSKHRNLIEMPTCLEPTNKHYYQQRSRRRRQSVATSTGASHIHWSVVVKDKINNDVSLRYQLDSPFLGIRNRRFSAIGNAVVGGQRRASLLPFGLMHNQSLPKLIWDGDGEAHL